MWMTRCSDLEEHLTAVVVELERTKPRMCRPRECGYYVCRTSYQLWPVTVEGKGFGHVLGAAHMISAASLGSFTRGGVA